MGIGGFGKWGEDQAVLFLQRNGFKVVDRNYHATVGEIDIVAAKSGDYYFVEVKTRVEGPFANDLAVTLAKKKKMLKTISQYCGRKNIRDVGIIPTTLMVVVNRTTHSVKFRLTVLY
jgi:Holliday junction resolvase-like predicted endonuclease